MYTDDYLCHSSPKSFMKWTGNSPEPRNWFSPKKPPRLELVEAEFSYLHSVASTYHLFRAYQVAPGKPRRLQKQVAHYYQTYDWLYPEGQARYPAATANSAPPSALAGLQETPPSPKFPAPHLTGTLNNSAKPTSSLPILKPRIRGGQILSPLREMHNILATPAALLSSSPKPVRRKTSDLSKTLFITMNTWLTGSQMKQIRHYPSGSFPTPGRVLHVGLHSQPCPLAIPSLEGGGDFSMQGEGQVVAFGGLVGEA